MSLPGLRARRPGALSIVAGVLSVAAALQAGASDRVPTAVLSAAVSRVKAATAGSIEGTIIVRADGTRTAERYVSSSGEPKDAPVLPTVIYIQGPLASGSLARPPARVELVQRGEQFHPGLLVVPVGSSVGFPNQDPEFHNVFSYSRPKRFDLGRYRQGESKTVVFDKPGYVKVLCEVHKWMRAGIVVVENPYFAVTGDNGRYRIESVPAGKHQLVIEHFDKRPHVVPVEVREGETTRIDVRL